MEDNGLERAFIGTVNMDKIVEKFGWEVLNDAPYENISIGKAKTNRPALQLTGFFDYFDEDRIQIIGMVEFTYASRLTSEERRKVFMKICEFKVPAILLSRSFEPFPELVEACEKYSIPLFRTTMETTDAQDELLRYLRVQLAPTITKHGVLVDIYGEGVLIMGESGIGKSETALELIKRGHRLVADDSVEIRRVSSGTLVGTCPDIIQYFIELRGIGIINVRQLFGVESVKATQQIDLIIYLEHWKKEAEYDRLGLSEKYMNILGNKVVMHNIPVSPGRNVAIICETAAINHRQKKMGYNAAEDLNARIMKNLTKNLT
ncbi:MAG: HPr(Ser) kinase/phosphatase [Lachnospirales bacterium]